MVRTISPAERIISELFEDAPAGYRCPYIQKDEKGPYCAKDLKKDVEISSQRRIICDVYSL